MADEAAPVGRIRVDADGEADAASALDWLQSTNPQASQTWVGGYQFGAYVGILAWAGLWLRDPWLRALFPIATRK